MWVAGCDPGLTGAVAVLGDVHDPVVDNGPVWDLPTETRIVNKRERETPDVHATLDLFAGVYVLGVEVLFLEHVSGMPGQSGPAAFNFGYGFGVVRAAALAAGLRVELVQSARWKRMLKAPVDKKASIARATELMPARRHAWTVKGQSARNSGRAEAAMIALWGLRYGL